MTISRVHETSGHKTSKFTRARRTIRRIDAPHAPAKRCSPKVALMQSLVKKSRALVTKLTKGDSDVSLGYNTSLLNDKASSLQGHVLVAWRRVKNNQDTPLSPMLAPTKTHHTYARTSLARLV